MQVVFFFLSFSDAKRKAAFLVLQAWCYTNTCKEIMEKGPGDSTLTKPKCKLEGFWNSSLYSVTISTLVIVLHACKQAA